MLIARNPTTWWIVGIDIGMAALAVASFRVKQPWVFSLFLVCLGALIVLSIVNYRTQAAPAGRFLGLASLIVWALVLLATM